MSILLIKVAMEVLLKYEGVFFPFTKVGRWWDKGEEIDSVGINPEINSILFAGVKSSI